MQVHLAKGAMSAVVCLALNGVDTSFRRVCGGSRGGRRVPARPALSSSFAPWDCKAKLTGPVCIGERHLSDDWAPIPNVCDVPIWGSRVEHRYQTGYYDHDYLNYYREFRTNYLSSSLTGPATASISTKVRCFGTLDVPGDDPDHHDERRSVVFAFLPRVGDLPRGRHAR